MAVGKEVARVLTPSPQRLSAQEVVDNRDRIKCAMETGTFRELCLQACMACDKGQRGCLAWTSGEIRTYITVVLSHYGLKPPPETQVFQLFAMFDKDRSGSLAVGECCSLVEMIVCAAFNIRARLFRQGAILGLSVGMHSACMCKSLEARPSA